VLSLDGPAEVQDRHRPTAAGTGTFDAVLHTAEILSESSAELVVRSCVTETSVPTLVTWAERIASELRPSVVCLERMTPSARSDAAGLRPPDPWCFARSFLDASRVLRQHGILAVTSTTDLRECRPSCCPVGRDALIVMPDGTVNACYLLEQRWRAAGLDLRLGSVGADDRALHLDPVAVDRVRTLAATPAARCTRCLCRLHCAGGCHVDHRPGADDDGYDDLCVSTRVLTIAQLLERLGRDDLAASWLADDGALATSARWPSDLIGASS
jgi:radical SAM protein with 4Fe4S-binding SPASM domain